MQSCDHYSSFSAVAVMWLIDYFFNCYSVCDTRPCNHYSTIQPLQLCDQKATFQPFQYVRRATVWSLFDYSAMATMWPEGYFSAISMSATGDRVIIFIQLFNHVTRRLLFNHFNAFDSTSYGRHCSVTQPCHQEDIFQPFQCARQNALRSSLFDLVIAVRWSEGYFSAFSMRATRGRVILFIRLFNHYNHMVKRLLFSYFSVCNKRSNGFFYSIIKSLQSCD